VPKKKPTRATPTSKGVRPAADFPQILDMAAVAAEVLGAPVGKGPDGVYSILVAVAMAIHDPSPHGDKTLAAMYAVARGAKNPDDPFSVNVLGLISQIDLLLKVDTVLGAELPTSRLDYFLALRAADPFLAKVLEGLDDADARELLSGIFIRLETKKIRGATGVTVELLHAAAQRGVDFGRGANLSRQTNRALLADMVGKMKSRERKG
jgi:hypothetical protein